MNPRTSARWTAALLLACGAGSLALAQHPPRSTAASSSPAPAPQPGPEKNPVERALAYDPADPLGQLETADAIDRLGGDGSTGARGPRSKAPGPLSCTVLAEAQRVWAEPSPPAIATVGTGFVIAGYGKRDQHERVFVVRAELGRRPEPITAFALEVPAQKPRKLAPALAVRDENDIAVAFVTGDNRLWVRRLRLGRAGHGAATPVAEGLDPRFAPALIHHHDRTLLAFTLGTTPMRTQLTTLSSEDVALANRDLTPSGMGATAPTFVDGATPPVLIAVDARNGMSPILRVEFMQDGTPKPAEVALPVGMVSTPPQLAAAASQTESVVAYTGIGRAATSAVGLVRIAPSSGKPHALVPGTAYGPLHVAAAAMARSVVVASDAPTRAGKDPRREVHVHVAHHGKVGPVTVIGSARGAAHAAVAHAGSGQVAVAYSNDSGVYVAYLHCADARR